MNAQLEHRIAHARVITEVVELGCPKPSKDTRLPDRIAEGLQPRIELSSPKENAHFVMYPFGYARARTLCLGQPNAH
jgi:hypothetical protein